MPVGKRLPMEPTNFNLDTFVGEVRPILQTLENILGREDTNIIGKAILGIFILMTSPKAVFDLPPFLEKMVNSQLTNISLTRCFRFPSLVTYLLLYAHAERFMNL